MDLLIWVQIVMGILLVANHYKNQRAENLINKAQLIDFLKRETMYEFSTDRVYFGQFSKECENCYKWANQKVVFNDRVTPTLFRCIDHFYDGR